MPEIFDITPGRGRASEAGVTIDGAAFAPSSPFGNSVQFDGTGVVSISSQDEDQIVCAAPGCSFGFGLCVTDQWITVAVRRGDTQEWATYRWWVKAALETLKTDSRLSEKIPTGEDLDNPTNEALTATLWNRLVTFVEWIAQEVLTAKGSVMSRDSDGLQEVLVGTNGHELRRTPAGSGHPTGLIWGPPKRVWTYRWGRLIDASNTRNGAMEASGDASSTTTGVKAGTHGMARAGVLRYLVVNVESASGGDTLDQVTVVYAGSTTIHNSGTGLAIGADGTYQVELDTWRPVDDLEVRAFKTGTGGTMELTAILTVEEELRPASSGAEDLISDSISVTDSITAEVILGGESSDTAAVTDSIAVEMSYAVDAADSVLVSDAIAREAEFEREPSDEIILGDQIGVESL